MKRQQDKSAAYWDRRAASYDRALGDGRGHYQDILRQVVAHLKKGAHVADLACGNGALACAMAAQASQVETCDLSVSMLNQARARAVSAGMNNIHFQQQDVLALNYKEDHFDAVCLLAVLHLLDQPEKALREALRVTKPGGLLFLSAYLSGNSAMGRVFAHLMKLSGYQDRQRFDEAGFLALISAQGLTLLDHRLYPVFPHPHGFAIAQKPMKESRS